MSSDAKFRLMSWATWACVALAVFSFMWLPLLGIAALWFPLFAWYIWSS